jgi:hypothetical protein
MSSKEWEKRNQEHIAEIAGDDSLGDADYIEVLEDLVDLAESAINAKREEMDKE